MCTRDFKERFCTCNIVLHCFKYTVMLSNRSNRLNIDWKIWNLLRKSTLTNYILRIWWILNKLWPRYVVSPVRKSFSVMSVGCIPFMFIRDLSKPTFQANALQYSNLNCSYTLLPSKRYQAEGVASSNWKLQIATLSLCL